MSWWKQLFRRSSQPEGEERPVSRDDLLRIIPVLRLASETAAVSAAATGADNARPELAPVTEPFVDDLTVSFALDPSNPRNPTLVRRLDCQRLGIRPAELWLLALASLRRLIPQAELRPMDAVFLVATGGACNESSLLLDNSFWETQRQKVRGDVVAAAPALDTLLFTGSHSPRGLEALRAVVHLLHGPDGTTSDHVLLSRSLLVRQDGNWRVYERIAVNEAG